jgi:hypothetical protein
MPRSTPRSTSAIVLAVLAATLVTATPAAAQSNSCIAGKIACTNVFASAVFKCYAKLFKAGFTADTQEKGEECVRKARQKFGTALSSKVQCWDKVEAKEKAEKPETVCPANIFDEFDVDSLVEDFTLDVANNEIAPGGPVPFGSTCSAGKVTCLGKLFKAMLACEAKAHKAGVPTDAVCIAKAIAKFDGGGDPAKGCFAKLEARQKLGKLKTLCDAVGNAQSALGKANLFVGIVVVGLEP